jgi:glycosyltransferase involved in cell wall biosynthesis
MNTQATAAPSVCVVLAVFNGMRFLPEQFDSVLGQLRSSDEVLVVDDASNDGSAQWIATRSDPRVTLHRNPHNLGAIRSFERGLALTRHDIVFLCDQDDVWLPGKRDAVVAAFQSNPGTAVVVSDARVIDARGNVTAPSFMATRGGFRAGQHTLAQSVPRLRNGGPPRRHRCRAAAATARANARYVAGHGWQCAW